MTTPPLREQPLSLTPNGKGAQCYFRKEFLDVAPVEPGDDLRATAVTCGILLVPETDHRTYRVEQASSGSNPGGSVDMSRSKHGYSKGETDE